MNLAQFNAAMDHAVEGLSTATDETVKIFFVGAYRDVSGLAPVDTGAHRAGVAPFKGSSAPAALVRRPEDSYPHPSDGLARTIAASFRSERGDRIAIADTAVSPKGFPYGIVIQPPADRPLFGFPAGSKPAVSRQAPRGDFAVVYKRVRDEFPVALEAAIEREWRGEV